MYDHHILIFVQNSLLLHGGYLELKDPMYPHFVFFLNKTLIKHLVFWGRVYRKEIFLFAIKLNVEIFTFGIVSRYLVVYSSYLAQT